MGKMQGRIKDYVDCLALLAQKDTEIKSSEERWKNRCDTLEATGAETETGKLEEVSAGGGAGGVQDTKKRQLKIKRIQMKPDLKGRKRWRTKIMRKLRRIKKETKEEEGEKKKMD